MKSTGVSSWVAILLSAHALSGDASGPSGRSNVEPVSPPHFDHIVVVLEENKSYEQVIGNPAAPYINQVLRAEGANLTRMFAEEQLTFRGYAEGLPGAGSTVGKAGRYARKHVPWVSFANIPQGSEPGTSTNLPFADFPSDFSRLPTVAFVVPDLSNDMHDPAGQTDVAVKNGDDWLRKYIDPYYQWAKKNNSLLTVTFDESDNPRDQIGYTDPGNPNAGSQNRIPTIIAGARVRHGDYAEGKGVTHVNILRTIEAVYGLWASGAQSANALKYGITSEYVIQDTFIP